MSISINSVRKSISLYWDGNIAEDLLVEIRDRVNKYEVEVIKEVIKDFKDYNRIRRFHHLSLLKRLSQPKIYKEADDRKSGEIGENPIVIQSSQSRRGVFLEK